MKTSRRKFSSSFQAKVAIGVLRERETIQQIAAHYEVHPLPRSVRGNVSFWQEPRGLW